MGSPVRWPAVKLFVTGGAGFIGSNYVRHVLRTTADDVTVYDALTYSASKAGSDLIALSYHHTYGLPVTVTRCTNNFGPYQFPEKVIPLFVTNVLDGEKMPLYGDGLNERDWLYVDDHCAAVQLVLRQGM